MRDDDRQMQEIADELQRELEKRVRSAPVRLPAERLNKALAILDELIMELHARQSRFVVVTYEYLPDDDDQGFQVDFSFMIRNVS